MALTHQALFEAANVNSQDLREFLNTLGSVAREATRRYFRGPLAVEHKRDATPVTIADRETEQLLRTCISQRFPDHGIIGEELADDCDDRHCVWVIDPIDGTRSFITGVPLFGTLVGFVVASTPVAGLLEMPALGERWISVSGLGTEMAQTTCHTSDCQLLSNATLFATAPEMFSNDETPRFAALSRQVRLARFGADCYAYGLVASGFVELVVEADMKPHDYIALIPLIEGAGGVISDWNGRSLDFQSDGRVVAAANPVLHRAALEILSD